MLLFSKTVFKTIVCAAALLILSGHPADTMAAQVYDIGIVTTDRLNVRSEPAMTSSAVLVLKQGSKVRILEQHDGWLKIVHQDLIGYVRNSKEYIRIIQVENVAESRGEDTGSAEKNIRQIKEKARNIDEKIKKGQAKVQTFIKKESTIINSLDSIDMALNAARKRSAQLESELPALEKQIEETVRTSKDLVKQIETDQKYVSKRLVSLYKLNWLGHLNILASANSIYDLFLRKKTLELILDYDKATLETLMKNKADLQLLLARLNAQKVQKLELETELNQQISLMSQKKARRAQLLEDIRSKKSFELAAIESLKQVAQDLDQTIKSLSATAMPLQQARKISPKNFTSLKGLLNMPVQGKIVSFFGPYKDPKFNLVNFRSGIEIKADRGEPIRAVYHGKVLYANWFKGYGNMIIIDHGNSYYTIYAHAEELFTSKGNIVEKGEVVATVGETDSLIGPSLHFEVRYHGKPVDPLKWFKKG